MSSLLKTRLKKSTSFAAGLTDEPQLPKKSFNTEDFRTSIKLLSSSQPDIVLKAVGTLSRCATSDPQYLPKYIAEGIYPKLVTLLQHRDIIILKFSLKLLALLASDQFLRIVDFKDIIASTELLTRHFIEKSDNFIQECCSFILLAYVKHSEVITNQIYSDQLMGAIFQVFRNTDDLDILWNSLNLLYYLLDVEIAKHDITRNNVYTSKVLVCLLECQQEGVKDLVMDILVKLSSWRMNDVSLLLSAEHVLKVMVKILLNVDKSMWNKAFAVLQNCISNEKCALEFGNTIEFTQFIHNLSVCTNNFLLKSLPIMNMLCKLPDLRQKLFDLSFDLMVLSWLKYQHNDVILSVLQIINDLSEHKRFCEAFSKYAVIKIIKGHISEEGVLKQPYGERAIATIRNFLIRVPVTISYLAGCDGIPLILNLFTDHEEELSNQAYKHVVEMIGYFANSKYSVNIFTDKEYEKIIGLYKTNGPLRFRILNLINILGKHENFRNFLVDSKTIEELVRGMKEDRTSYGSRVHLEIISNLVKYQKIGYKLWDLGVYSFLKDVKPKVHLTIIEDILKDLSDYCLTMKFYESGRLEAHNRIDDRFYLIRDDISQSALESFTFADCKKPVYVVSVMLVKITRDVEEVKRNDSLASALKKPLNAATSEHTLSTNSTYSSNNVKLSAIYRHGEIPTGLLFYRTKSTQSQTSQFYADYYLERYILTLLRELYYSDTAPAFLKDRIGYIAKYVDRQLSGLMEGLTEDEEEEIFEKHLTCLKENTGTNVIPIGFLRMGYHCERALLFKVLCDNVCVPVTLCRGVNDMYWNEVAFSVAYEGDHYVKEEQNVYIVDLMNNIGDLIPLQSLEAQEYLSTK